MPLIKCPDCGKDISSTAKNCLDCGYRPERQYWRVFAVAVILALICGFALASSASPLFALASGLCIFIALVTGLHWLRY